MWLLITLSLSIALETEIVNEPSYTQEEFTEEMSHNVLLQIFIQNRLTEYIHGNARHESFRKVMKMIVERKALVLVELGTLRHGRDDCSEGCSTLLLGSLAQVIGAKLYSVDNNENFVSNSRSTVRPFKDSVEVIKADSVDFLLNFDQENIDFLYIDSSEFDSQLHEREITAAYEKLHKHSIILIDDCNNPHVPNCQLLEQFLFERGWVKVFSEYQQIYSFI